MSHICANCGIPIHWQPTLVDGIAYCCVGCAGGGPCTCDYSHLPQWGDSASLIQIRQTRTIIRLESSPEGEENERH